MSRGQVRQLLDTGELSRLHRGVYTGRDTDAFDGLRGLLLRMPEGVLLGMQTAAALYGFGGPEFRGVHVIVPKGIVRPRIRGVVTHEAILPVGEPLWVHGLPCAPPARCAIDLARHLPRFDALPVLDAALRTGVCSPEDLALEVHRHARLRRVRQARELMALADPRAECVQESQLRLMILDAGLPAPEPQVWVPDDWGSLVYRIDLAYPRRRVGIEYDGGSHLDRTRLQADRLRMNWLDSHGWLMRYFTARDLYRRPGLIVSTVRDALATRR